MGITLARMDPAGIDGAALASFLTTQVFPFHVRPRWAAAQVRASIDDGAWHGDAVATFWIDDDRDGRVGVLRLDDLDDATAMIDLRLADDARGRGHGSAALRIATDLVFSRCPAVIRFEGQTREDNVAMRRVFERCGWVHEAFYRDGWPVEGAEPVASVAYSVLRRDWATGTTTPVPRGPEYEVAGRARDAESLAAAAWSAEERLLNPAVRADPRQVTALLDPSFVEIGQSGRRWTRDATVAALREDPGADDAPEICEKESRLVGPDNVLLTYLLRFEDRVSRRSSLWRFDPAPRCLFHQGTPVA
jgi:RimJ/RimL family protein N-acetyltransferase